MRLALPSVFLLALSGAAACVTTQAQTRTPVQLIALDPPPPPARVVVPVPPEPDPVPAPVAPPPAGAPTHPAAPSRSDRADSPATPPARTPDAPTAPVVPQTLLTTVDAAAMKKRIQGVLDKAQADLHKVDYRSLSAGGQGQYNSARELIRRADDLLKVMDYLQADQLAKKAANLAGLLVRG